MLKSKKVWLLGGALLLLSCMSVRASAQSTDEGCPRGFEPIPSGLACGAVILKAADGTFSGVTVPFTPPQPCPEGFEKPDGVNFCVAKNITVNALGSMPLLEKQTSRFCPEGFHRPTGSTICIASNLTISEVDGTLQGPTQECPVGFYRPVGTRFCVAGIVQGNVSVLPQPVGPKCPKGFHRPPGVAICLPTNVVYGTFTPTHLSVPTGACPAGWIRPAGVRFCIPAHKRMPPNTELVLGFTGEVCPIGTSETWFDVPVYDEETGWWVVDYVPTRFCVPDDLEPAG